MVIAAFSILALATSTLAFVQTSLPGDAVTRSSALVAAKVAADPSFVDASAVATASALNEFDHFKADRLPYSPTGYCNWAWKTHHNQRNQLENASINSDDAHRTTHFINYLEVGDASKPAVLLIHGFGASSYHWRHNVPKLARDYHVYALDLLGFGWSDKPVMDYDASVWRDQVVDFVREVVLNGDERNERSIAIAGNSLGGYTAMYSSSDRRIKDNVKACILLNAAGRFRDPEAPEEPLEPNPIVKAVSSAIQRFVIACSFVYTKQPSRIEQILRQVYPINDLNVDTELVNSIHTPALADTAAEVFFRVIAKNGSGPQAYVDDILQELECATLLCWGESDPWIKPAAADRMERLHAEFHGNNVGGENGPSRIERVNINAGHCPHDEAPEAVNNAILGFLEKAFVDV